MNTLSRPNPPCDSGPGDGSEPTAGRPAVDAVGVGRPGGTRTLLRSDDFACPSCVAKIEKQVGRLPGVSGATVHFGTGRIEVEHDPGRVSVQDLVAVVAKAGYRAWPAAW